MTIYNISPSMYLVGKIRQGYADGSLTDYNSANRVSTFSNFVYPDKPRVTELLKNKNNFPRISIESMDQSTIQRLGMQSTQYHDLVQLSINIWCPPTLTCETLNVPTEDNTYVTGTDIYALDNVPISIIGSSIDGTKDALAYSFTKGTDYQLIDNNYDGLNDSIEWLGVNIPDDGTTFTCSYNRKATGEELCRLIAYNLDKYIRENWLTWLQTDHELKYYKVISIKPIKLDDYVKIDRYEIFCSFTGVDIGKQI